jgi:hypothetical protein
MDLKSVLKWSTFRSVNGGLSFSRAHRLDQSDRCPTQVWPVPTKLVVSRGHLHHWVGFALGLLLFQVCAVLAVGASSSLQRRVSELHRSDRWGASVWPVQSFQWETLWFYCWLVHVLVGFFRCRWNFGLAQFAEVLVWFSSAVIVLDFSKLLHMLDGKSRLAGRSLDRIREVCSGPVWPVPGTGLTGALQSCSSCFFCCVSRVFRWIASF